MTQTMAVTVKYNLSPAGQRAALLAGRAASQTVIEQMELTDPAMLEQVAIAADGSLSLDASKDYAPDGVHRAGRCIYFDAPPVLAEVIAAYVALRARVDAEIAHTKSALVAQAAELECAAAEKAAHDSPLLDALLDQLEALDPLAPLPQGVYAENYPCRLVAAGYRYEATEAQAKRIERVLTARHAARQAEIDSKAAAKQAARDAIVEQHGGYMWMPESGMCGFKGYDLWDGAQSKRWVGVFSQPKGIDTFLDSPRGEHTWDVSGLQRGDCIQGGGFDTNSRGKRRHETEFFGVVLRNDAEALVIQICDARSEALKAGRKILG